MGLSWNILVIVIMSQSIPETNRTEMDDMKSPPVGDFGNETASNTSLDDTDYFMSITSRNVDYNTLWENLTVNLKTDPDVQYYREYETLFNLKT